MDVALVLTALSYGLLPVFIWLVFWLFEDRKHPEPKRLIALAFIAGMLAVPLAIVVSGLLEPLFGDRLTQTIFWSFTEEAMKYALAYVFVLRNREVNEALDVFIYMVCVALGFAAFENTLYAIGPLLDAQHIDAAGLTVMRFVGATLVHTVASASIGIALAFAFYKSRKAKTFALIYGLVIATSLHALFNFFIMNVASGMVPVVFVVVWFATLALVLLAERIKKIDALHATRH
jgi:RsiW-degrading membrane proteinase PrsW (M82 family)